MTNFNYKQRQTTQTYRNEYDRIFSQKVDDCQESINKKVVNTVILDSDYNPCEICGKREVRRLHGPTGKMVCSSCGME